MSTSRFVVGIVFSVLVLIAALIFLPILFDEPLCIESVLLAYGLAAVTGELIFWQPQTFGVGLWVCRLGVTVALAYIALMFNSLLGFIIALLILPEALMLVLIIFFVGAALILLFSAIFFPIHTVMCSRDLY